MNKTNCSVTVMLVRNNKIGFIRRELSDTFSNLLVACGGKVESEDGELVEGVKYYSVEEAALREVEEEIGIRLDKNDLKFFCSLVLPNGRVVISFYTILSPSVVSDKVLFLSPKEILERTDFAPGMKTESLLLVDKLLKGEWKKT